MPPTIPTHEPDTIRAGDSLQWDRTLTDYPTSDGWTLAYVLKGGRNNVSLILPATPISDVYQVRIPATQTQIYPPGQYKLTGRVTRDVDTFTIYEAAAVVEPDPAVSPDSYAEEMLKKAEAQLAAQPIGVTTWTQGARSESYGDAGSRNAQSSLGVWRDQVRYERSGKLFPTISATFVHK